MNNKHKDNGALTGPLLFTLPASSFVVVLSFDWLDRTQLFPPKTHGWNYLATRPANCEKKSRAAC
jgi:hypothetical protein